MIRTLDPVADLEFVSDIEARCFDTSWGRDDHRKQFEVPGCGGLILEACGKRAAVLVHQPAECGTYVRLLVVDPKFRRRGYGRQLLRHLISRGEPLSLHVRQDNKVAKNLYRSLGFTAIREEVGFYGADDPDVADLMIRP